jgi:PAS domain S-box-containing protein
MYEAGKSGTEIRRPELIPARQEQSDAAELANDYKFSPVCQLTLDRNGCIRRLNLAACVLLKGEPAQLINVPFIAFVGKAYCRLFLDHMAAAINANREVCTRLALSELTNAVGPVELRSKASLDPTSGQLLCRTAIVSLSPRRHRAATDFLSHQNGYEEWFQLFSDAAILEIEGKIISANAGALDILGAKSVDEVQGKKIWEILHSDSHESFADRISSLPEGKSESSGVEVKFIRSDGEEIIANVILRSVNFDGVFAILIVARDIVREREMKEGLARANDFAMQILANNSIATAILSLKTERFIAANEIFCRLTAIPDEKIVGQPISVIGLSTGEQGDFFRWCVSGTDNREWDSRLNRPDGSVLDILVSAKRIPCRDESCLLLMIQDLTDLRRLRNDVVSISEAEQRRFGRDLHDSHCQDLTAIAFFAETIAAGLSPRDEEAVRQLRMLVDMVQKSVENVHALAAGLDSEHIQDSGLGFALQELADSISRRFGLICEARIDPALENGSFISAIHIYRIAQEAVSNAAKHGHARTVTLELRLDGDTGLLQVTDDGTGFVAEEKSTGLGLRTMQYRASIMEGKLRIDSRPGSGTTVSCSFPISTETRLARNDLHVRTRRAAR